DRGVPVERCAAKGRRLTAAAATQARLTHAAAWAATVTRGPVRCDQRWLGEESAPYPRRSHASPADRPGCMGSDDPMGPARWISDGWAKGRRLTRAAATQARLAHPAAWAATIPCPVFRRSMGPPPRHRRAWLAAGRGPPVLGLPVVS